MSGVWPWIAAVVVVGLALGIHAVRTQQNRTRVHDAAVRRALDADREIQQLEQQYRLPAREHEGRGRA